MLQRVAKSFRDLLALLGARRRPEPTFYQRTLAVHLYYAAPRSAFH